MEKQYLTLEEAAEEFQKLGLLVKQSSIRSLIAQKKLPAIRVGKRIYLNRADIPASLRKLSGEFGALNLEFILGWAAVSVVVVGFWVVATCAILGSCELL